MYRIYIYILYMVHIHTYTYNTYINSHLIPPDVSLDNDHNGDSTPITITRTSHHKLNCIRGKKFKGVHIQVHILLECTSSTWSSTYVPGPRSTSGSGTWVESRIDMSRVSVSSFGWTKETLLGKHSDRKTWVSMNTSYMAHKKLTIDTRSGKRSTSYCR